MANRRVLRMSTQRITFSPYARARIRDGIFALSVLARFMTSFSPFCMGALFAARPPAARGRTHIIIIVLPSHKRRAAARRAAF